MKEISKFIKLQKKKLKKNLESYERNYWKI